MSLVGICRNVQIRKNKEYKTYIDDAKKSLKYEINNIIKNKAVSKKTKLMVIGNLYFSRIFYIIDDIHAARTGNRTKYEVKQVRLLGEKISVIVPIYKVEEYLHRCIDSIINQTYTNLEIILVDDGSPDNCPMICDEYAKKDSRIRVIHKKNGGLSDARNAGLEIATGEYIGFVDSDDWIHKDMYHILYKNIIEKDADIAECSIKKERNYLNSKDC